MIKIKRGLDLPIAGAPGHQVEEGAAVRSVALIGADFPGLMPTMRVQEGDRVLQGQPLFADKKIPELVFTAPVTGRVRAIHRGARRVFQSLVIDVDGHSDEALTFPSWPATELERLDRELVKAQLLASGLWLALRTRPFGKVPNPADTPVAVFVNAMDSNPLAADPALVIAAEQQAFNDGLSVVSTLADKFYVCKRAGAAFQTGRFPAQEFAGPHPSGLVGTHIHFLEPVSASKVVWHLSYQDVIAIGKLFTTGRIDPRRVIALAGPQVQRPRLLRTVLGASVDDLVAGELVTGSNRVISGSVLSGRRAEGAQAYLGRYHLQVSVLEEGHERRFLEYLRPGADKHSVLNTYLGKFIRRVFPMTTTSHGSPRAMVPVGTYEEIMPLDILPTLLLRYLLVGDTDTAQALGCLELDEEDLGLCTYVCPGKYEYGPILRDVLTRIEVEG